MAKKKKSLFGMNMTAGGFLEFLNKTPFGLFDNLAKSFFHSGVTDAEYEKMAAEDEYLDENREEDYMIRKRAWDEMDSPEAQMRSQAKGLEAVGINKMALAGNVASGASSSTAESSAPSGDVAHGDLGSFISSVMDAISMGEKIKDIKATIGLKKSQTVHQDIINKWTDKQQEIEYKNKVFTSNLIQANTRKLSAEAENAEWQALYAPDLFQSQIDERDSNVAKAYSDIERNVSEISLNEKRKKEIDSIIAKNAKEMELIDANIKKINQEYWNLCAEENLTQEKIKECKANVAKLNSENLEIASRINLNEKDLQYYIWNHPRSSRAAGFQWNNSSRTGDASIQSLEGWDTPALEGELRRRGVLK